MQIQKKIIYLDTCDIEIVAVVTIIDLVKNLDWLLPLKTCYSTVAHVIREQFWLRTIFRTSLFTKESGDTPSNTPYRIRRPRSSCLE
jgi:hypothetical protein